MVSWIISDLHLSAQRPAVTQAFLHWLTTEVANAQALYILGDFFEVWVGDDVLEDRQYGAEFVAVVAGLRALSAKGVQLFLMHGNRDFLLGAHFAQACGLRLLADPTLIHLGEKRVLLTHGDALCTDDVAYQQFRQTVRQTQWQQTFLAQSLSSRVAFAEQARMQSRQNKSMQDMDIMDVNSDAVSNLICAFDYPDVLLHGHTHRPAIHTLSVDGYAAERWVLGDWDASAVVVRIDDDQLQQHTIALSHSA